MYQCMKILQALNNSIKINSWIITSYKPFFGNNSTTKNCLICHMEG
jgi:hypothetical protein